MMHVQRLNSGIKSFKKKSLKPVKVNSHIGKLKRIPTRIRLKSICYHERIPHPSDINIRNTRLEIHNSPSVLTCQIVGTICPRHDKNISSVNILAINANNPGGFSCSKPMLRSWKSQCSVQIASGMSGSRDKCLTLTNFQIEFILLSPSRNTVSFV